MVACRLNLDESITAWYPDISSDLSYWTHSRYIAIRILRMSMYNHQKKRWLKNHLIHPKHFHFNPILEREKPQLINAFVTKLAIPIYHGRWGKASIEIERPSFDLCLCHKKPMRKWVKIWMWCECECRYKYLNMRKVTGSHLKTKQKNPGNCWFVHFSYCPNKCITHTFFQYPKNIA